MTDRYKTWDEDLRQLCNNERLETIINARPPDKSVSLSPQIQEFLHKRGEVCLHPRQLMQLRLDIDLFITYVVS